MQAAERNERGWSGGARWTVAIALALAGAACGGSPAGSSGDGTTEAAVAAQPDPGQRVELDGELEVTYEDLPDGTARLTHVLRTRDERLPLHFEGDHPGLLSGTRVRARGLRSGGALKVDASAGVLTLGASGTSSGTAPAVVPGTLGEQKTLVLLVNFQDQPAQPYTVDQARSLVFGTVSDFFREGSYGQTWLTGDVQGWLTIPLSGAICDHATLATQANAAAQAAGVNLSAYSHLVYVFENACTGRGIGTVGGSPSQAWINRGFELEIIAHELGHNLGLWHSHSRDCGATTLGTTCTFSEYGHTFDMMGNTSPGHFNAFQKERLGWLNAGVSPPITTVSADGTYVLDALEPAGSGPKALKVLKSVDPATGKKTWYYVEARQAVGFDGFLAGNANVTGGVLVSTGSESSGDTSDLLDLTPASATFNFQDWADPALATGRTFQDSESGVTLTTQWVSSTQAAVTVRVGTATAPQPAQPTVTVSTDRTSYDRSQTVTVTAQVASGGAAVAGATVSFRITKANGAIVTGTATTASSGSATWKLRLQRKDPAGTWQASATSGASATTSFAVR